jgi:ketosteroid isomerase-like protein
MMNQSDEPSLMLQTLHDYYKAFSTLDASRVLPYFNEPAMLISPQGVYVAESHAVLAKVFASIMETCRARGFGRSEPSMPMVKQLSATAGLTSDTAIRYRGDGSELDRAGATCVLRKTSAGWKIAVAVVHDVQET